MRLPFEAEAADEFVAAAEWYEADRIGYGEVFVSEVRTAVERAADFPNSGVRVEGSAPDRDVRLFRTRRFPFSVVTALVAGRRAVVAVAHTKSRPGAWRDRLA